jgi:Domain of unknown function (DUF4276)
VTARIYIEGGGEGQLLDTLFRQGWAAFFRSAGLEGRMPRVVRGQGRLRTFDLFITAVTNPRPGELPLLLVDSEGPLVGRTAWEHLKASDDWDRPTGASDDQAFLMVQVMETWFLADRELLRRHFGASLHDNALRAWPSLEGVPKNDVLSALGRATADCDPPYSKGKISFKLLAQLSPHQVEAACPNARRLLDRLRELGGP